MTPKQVWAYGKLVDERMNTIQDGIVRIAGNFVTFWSKFSSVTLPLRRVVVSLTSDNQILLYWILGEEGFRLVVPASQCGSVLAEYITNPAQREHLLSITRRARNRVLLTVAAIVLVCSAGVLAVCKYVVPSVADKLAETMPVETEKEIGRAVAEQLFKHDKACLGPEMNRQVIRVAAQLESNITAPSPPPRFEIIIIDRSEPLAFSLPGGYVILYTGLLKLIDTPDELAAVLAHEFQHILLKHGLKNVLRHMGLSAFVLMLTGGSKGATDLLLNFSVNLNLLAFSRRQEEIADREAVILLAVSGFDPSALAKILNKIQAWADRHHHVSIPELFSTHPDTQKRIKKINELIQRLPTHLKRTDPLFQSLGWKKSCECLPVNFSAKLLD